jgi:hypothetical protein
MITTSIALAAAAGIVGTILVLHAYLHWRGAHVVLCPRNRRFAAVEFDAIAAVRSWLTRSHELRIKKCTEWPVPECRNACLKQVGDDADTLRPSSLAKTWFEGRTCTYCRKAIPAIEPFAHQPALRVGERLVPWNEVPPADLPPTLATARPVCWNCYVAEVFRMRYPELVVDAPNRGRESLH